LKDSEAFINAARFKKDRSLQNDVTKYQGCQMVYFNTKNPNLGKFGSAWEWKMLVCFKTIWNILQPFGITYGRWQKYVTKLSPHFHKNWPFKC
jgi:hypothetical protein